MEYVLSNGDLIRNEILSSFKNANSQIKIAMAYFTDKEICNAILEGIDKNIEVQIIISNDIKNEEIISLLDQKANLTVLDTAGYGIMHNKFAIVDNTKLIHGSYNYTYNAFRNNHETLNITDSIELINSYNDIFEKLATNKEMNQINTPTLEKQPAKSSNKDYYLEKFTTELKDHVSQIFDNFDEKQLAELGRSRAKESNCSEEVFMSYIDSALEEVNSSLNKDDQTKTIVKNRLKSSLDRATENIQEELDSKEKLVDTEKQNFEGKMDADIGLKEKDVLAKELELNELNKQINQTNSEISETQNEIDNIDRQIKIKKFWTFPTFLKGAVLLIFLFYLAIFFSSAFWKITFESSVLKQDLIAGITPEEPPLIDANAFFTIKQEKGLTFGIISLFICLIPLLLSSIKLIGAKNKVVKVLVGWVLGVFTIDIVVSILISKHTLELNNLLTGSDNTWSIFDAMGTAEFWLIFIFGSFPLIIAKVILENLFDAYNWSNPELVDREKFVQRKQLTRQLNELKLNLQNFETEKQAQQENLNKLTESLKAIQELKLKGIEDLNTKLLTLKERFAEQRKNLMETYNSFLSSVESGNKKFLQNLVSGRITVFREGFIQQISSYFSEEETSKRVKSLNSKYENWSIKNFS